MYFSGFSFSFYYTFKGLLTEVYLEPSIFLQKYLTALSC